MLSLIAVSACLGATLPARLTFDPQTVSVTARVAGREVPLVRGIGYSAHFSEAEEAFHTAGVASVEGAGPRWTIHFRMAGPAAPQSKVSCTVVERGGDCLTLTWKVDYTGPARAFFGWNDGLRLDLAGKPTGARTRPLIRWVKPTGRYDWQVAGDEPYPTLDRQLREIDLGGTRLAMLTDWYDPDWFYSHDLGRVPFLQLALPAKAPQKVSGTMTIVAPPAGLSDAALLALADGEPLGVATEHAPEGPVVAPGDPLGLTARLSNPTRVTQRGRLTWAVYDYYAHRVAHGDRDLSLASGASTSIRLAPDVHARRGIYFLAGELTMGGGKTRLLRTNVACLPPRQPRVDEASPFGMAALGADPERYPDQASRSTVLAMMARIGVHWLRGMGFPISADIKPEQVAAAHKLLDLLRRWGITPNVQCSYTVPKNDAGVAAFRRDFAAALAKYSFVSRYIEVGNELNYSATASDYVQRLLKPQYEVMRRVDPGGKVMNAGLGGVGESWWRAFVAADGLDYLDALSIHPGHHPRAPEFWEGWDGWVLRPQMLRVFNTLAQKGLSGKREVWVTEAYDPAGPERSSLNPRTAADYMVREYCIDLALGVRTIEWYQFRDGTWFSVAPNPTDSEWHYGMVYTDLTPRPQYVAYGTMTEQLEGARCLGRLDLGADDLWGFCFRKSDGSLVDVLWSYREKAATDLAWWPPEKFKNNHRAPAEPWQERWKKPVILSLPAASGREGAVTITDLMGSVRPLTAEGGKVALSLTGSPIYVRGLGAVPLRQSVW